MCTSFALRKGKTFIGMNFDSGAMKYKIALKDNNQFVILVNTNGAFYPSFGINANGTFVNDLMVDTNGEGKYKRQTDKRWITTRLVERVLSGEVKPEEIIELLTKVEIVNSPHYSTHSMVVDNSGAVTIIEPGRGILHSLPDESPFYLMTNFPLSGFDISKAFESEGSGADRYKIAHLMLSTPEMKQDVDDCFAVLEAVMQESGNYATTFSMVAIPEEGKVYFSIGREFEKRYRFTFSDQKIVTVSGFETEQEFVLSGGMTLDEIYRIIDR